MEIEQTVGDRKWDEKRKRRVFLLFYGLDCKASSQVMN